ncbi:MAG TPA: folylpolyglutamate synthase/dihydrofolate synthase family protein [Gammaproteobacteria bacterium]|jgi:dihydrofolate synthase/folylpolyglutamate synthase|nr:folylpolyglutamate synthase/dihydrofolate synthase family protein [Gammaproteobacteria bacterium]
MENWGLSEWLHWQETLNSEEIDLDLERIHLVASRLEIESPIDRTFLIAGTNGKGTTVALIEELLVNKKLRVGSYTSPHLIDYNERICVDKKPVDNARLIDSFKLIESVRGNVALTFFEFGTLSAFTIFNDFECDAWVIEVGLGGHLDATNIITPSISIITNVDLDHQNWLGNTIDEIAKEKAGIISPGVPCIFGDTPVPSIIQTVADSEGSDLYVWNSDFFLLDNGDSFQWKGRNTEIDSIIMPSHWGPGECNNLALSLTSIEIMDSELLPSAKELNHLLSNFSVPGRFEIIEQKQTWILDVAHNPHAAKNLKKKLESLNSCKKITVILSMMQDKDVIGFVKILDDLVEQWIVCEMDTPRSHSAHALQKKLIDYGITNVSAESGLIEAFSNIKIRTEKNDRILITGSFEIVGPAKRWLDSE